MGDSPREERNHGATVFRTAGGSRRLANLQRRIRAIGADLFRTQDDRTRTQAQNAVGSFRNDNGWVTKSSRQTYGNGYRIVQAPGVVVLMAEMIHEARVIPIDGRAHVGDGIRTYMGDSRGHWEGNTLVVETTNFNGKLGSTGNPVYSSTDLKVVERITRTEADVLRWEATVSDPKTYARPFTIHSVHVAARISGAALRVSRGHVVWLVVSGW